MCSPVHMSIGFPLVVFNSVGLLYFSIRKFRFLPVTELRSSEQEWKRSFSKLFLEFFRFCKNPMDLPASTDSRWGRVIQGIGCELAVEDPR